MKKFGKSLYAAALAALVLAACGKEPGQIPADPNGKLEVILGSNMITKPTSVSRVDDNNWGSLDGIGVYMLNSGMRLDDPGAIIEDVSNRHYQVRTETGDATKGTMTPFDNSNVIYYPLTAPTGNLKFVSYYPYTADVASDYTFPVDINDNTPLITAALDNQPWYDYHRPQQQPDPINMEFKHKMARIKINITAGDGFSYSDLSTVTVTFRNGNAKGTFSLADDAFIGSTVQVGDAQFSVVADPVARTMTAYLVMIPNSVDMDDRVLEFEHANLTGGGATIPLQSPIASNKHFAAATEYTYDAIVNRSVVTVEEGTIQDWNFIGELQGDDMGPRPDPDLGLLEQSLGMPNSYIWPAGETTFSIPVIKAYGMWLYDDKIENGKLNNYLNTAVDVYLVWADSSLLQFYTFEYDEPFEGAYLGNITITYDAVRGNAANPQGRQLPVNFVVGLRNLAVENETSMLWSWHVWVTDGDPEAGWQNRKNFNGTYTYYFMDRNLGAWNATPGNPGAKGLYYQLARKDPFIGTTGWNNGGGSSTKMYYWNNGVLSTRSTEGNGLIRSADNNPWVSPAGSVRSPITYAKKTWWNGTFGDNNAYALWGYAGSDKSHYDPCPEGWRVPGATTNRGTGTTDSPWYNSTIGTGDQGILNYNSSGRQTSDYGLVLNGTGTKMGTINGDYALGYFPFTGYRNQNGDTDGFNDRSRIWFSSGGYFKVDGNNVNGANGRDNNDYTYPIRCAKWVAGRH